MTRWGYYVNIELSSALAVGFWGALDYMYENEKIYFFH